MLKKKPCSEEGCSAPVWSGGKCQRHGKKSKGLKVRGKSPERKALMSEMIQIFEHHWIEHPDKCCESCGKQLWGENKTYYHDHLLPKNKYPHLTLEIENLFLCCLDCHSKKELGNPSEKHKIAIEQAKLTFDGI